MLAEKEVFLVTSEAGSGEAPSGAVLTTRLSPPRLARLLAVRFHNGSRGMRRYRTLNLAFTGPPTLSKQLLAL